MVVAEILDQGVELVVGNYDAQLAVALLFKGGGGEQPGDLCLLYTSDAADEANWV